MLKGVSFTVLGLGDQNYTKFMEVPRIFWTRLEECGGKPFYPRGEADEVDGIEEMVEQWSEGLWKAWTKELTDLKDRLLNPSKHASATTPASDTIPTKPLPADSNGQAVNFGLKGVPALAPCRIQLKWHSTEPTNATRERLPRTAVKRTTGEELYSPTEPFWASVSESKLLTATGSDRVVMHLGVSTEGSDLQKIYCPGDSIGVLPSNDAALVSKLLKRLGVVEEKLFSVGPAASSQQDLAAMANNDTKYLAHVPTPCTLRYALLYCFDVTSPPRKSLLRLLAEYCELEGEKKDLMELCSIQGKARFEKEIRKGEPGLIHLLERYKSCKPSIDHLLDVLPTLAPRYYSICSSPLAYKDQLQVAYSVVRYSTEMKYEKLGVATNWLQGLCSKENKAKDSSVYRIPIFLKRGGSFALPVDRSKPMIMVGPGTGVAPFRGFIQQRIEESKASSGGSKMGEAWLFFGCRREEEDYLYKEDLESYVGQAGGLTKLHVAFSRAGRLLKK